MDDDDLRVLLESPVPESSDGQQRGGSMAAVAVGIFVAVGVLAFLLLRDTGQETPPTDDPPTTVAAEPSTTTVPETVPVFPGPRVHEQAAFDHDSQEYVFFGGMVKHFGAAAEGTWVFAIGSGRWSLGQESGDEPAVRVGHAMVYVESLGGVLMYGGGTGRYTGAGCPITYCPVTILADTWFFDDGSWRKLDPGGGPGLRYGHSMAYDSDSDRVVLFGGLSVVPEFADEPVFLQETWVFDPTDNSWDQIESDHVPSARAFSQMAYDPDTDLIYLFGGMSEPHAGEDDLWAFDVDAGEWLSIETGRGPEGRWMHQMALDRPSGKLYVFGGEMRKEGDSGAGIGLAEDAWFFDPAVATWQPAPGLPYPMFTHSAVEADGGVIVSVGGGLYQHESGRSEWITLAEPE